MLQRQLGKKRRTDARADTHSRRRVARTPSPASAMKTFCEVCTSVPATLVCCADDALMCASCDERCVARRRPLAGKKKEDGWPRRNLRGSAGEARGRPRRRSTRAGVPPAALAAHRGAVLATSGARSLTPSPPSPDPLIRSDAAFTPPTRSSPNTSASRSSRPWRSPCATSARCARPQPPRVSHSGPPAELFALARRPERPRARARAPFAGASGRATPAGAFSALRRLSI